MANTLTFAGLTLTDVNIYGGITYAVDLNTGTEFSIGNTASASVHFTTDTQVPLYSKDSTNGTFTWTQDSTVRGRFFITEVTKTETGYFDVTAYDAMILLDTSVSALSISYPATVSGLASQIATYLGCTVSGTINNGTLSISALDDTKTIRQLLGWIAEASAASVKIDGSDHLCFMYYADSGITVTASEYKKLKIADYTCAAIDNVTIMGIDGQPCASAGSGTNTLYIQGNPFLYEATSAVASTILGIVDDYAYVPIECEMFDLNGIEVGTIATFGTTASLVMHIEEQTEEGVKVSSVGSDTRAELNKSVEVLVEQLDATVTSMSQHFWYTATGAEAGAHIAEVDKATFETTPAGGNLLSNSQGVKVRKGLDVLAEMSADGFEANVDNNAMFVVNTNGASEYSVDLIQYWVAAGQTVTIEMTDASTMSAIEIQIGQPGPPPHGFTVTVTLTYGTAASGSRGSVDYVYDGDETLTVTNTEDVVTRFVRAPAGRTVTAPFFNLGTRSGSEEAYGTIIGKSLCNGDSCQTVIGKYNEYDTGAFLIGNGTDYANRSNIFKVDWTGDLTAAGDIEDGAGNVLSTIKNASTLHSATVSSAYSGSCNYLKLGRMVIFDANIATTGALTNGTVLASGLPANHYTATMAYGFNNNSTTENVAVYMTSSGTLTVRGAFSAANRSIRVSGAYISAT